MGVDAGVDLTFQDKLHQLVLQGRHCGVEGRRHLVHIGRQIRAEVLGKKDGCFIYIDKKICHVQFDESQSLSEVIFCSFPLPIHQKHGSYAGVVVFNIFI